jgi:hypothetical protein
MLRVGLVGRFQSNPKQMHVHAVKRIFRYLQGIVDYVFSYPKETYLTLRAYIDVDWEGSVDGRKRTSGGAFFLGNYLVSWLSKKQTSIFLCITKSDYIETPS